MPTAEAISRTCPACGSLDVGNFCSNCGASMTKMHPVLGVLNFVFAPVTNLLKSYGSLIFTRQFTQSVIERRYRFVHLMGFLFGLSAFNVLILKLFSDDPLFNQSYGSGAEQLGHDFGLQLGYSTAQVGALFLVFSIAGFLLYLIMRSKAQPVKFGTFFIAGMAMNATLTPFQTFADAIGTGGAEFMLVVLAIYLPLFLVAIVRMCKFLFQRTYIDTVLRVLGWVVLFTVLTFVALLAIGPVLTPQTPAEAPATSEADQSMSHEAEEAVAADDAAAAAIDSSHETDPAQ